MNNYYIGSDIIGADATALVPQQSKAAAWLDKPAFAGLRTWQVGLASVGIVSLIAGIVTLAVKKRK